MKVAKYRLGKFAPDGDDSPIFKEPPPDDFPLPSVEEEWKRRQEERADPRTPIKLGQTQSASPIVPETGGSSLTPLALLAGALLLL